MRVLRVLHGWSNAVGRSHEEHAKLFAPDACVQKLWWKPRQIWRLADCPTLP
jgi:hypothetical protein